MLNVQYLFKSLEKSYFFLEKSITYLYCYLVSNIKGTWPLIEGQHRGNIPSKMDIHTQKNNGSFKLILANSSNSAETFLNCMIVLTLECPSASNGNMH
jgi:hypothetical protein